MSSPIPTENTPSLLRRLMAVLYDGMLLIAIWMAASALWLAFTGGQAAAAGDALYRLYLLAVSYAFFVGFWCLAGRTLGMQAWRLRVIDENGKRIGVMAATNRFVTAILSWLPLGGGFFWAMFDKRNLTWHDRLSKTYLYLEEKRR